MSETSNVGGAILILGLLWFGFNYGWSWWMVTLTVVSVTLVLSSWEVHGFSSERKALIRSETELNHAQANWYTRRW